LSIAKLYVTKPLSLICKPANFLAAGTLAAYLAMPIDLVPDFVPVAGQLTT
jgi:uncharacterized membrane protein YkvA (DUF1232 family)